MLTPTGVTVIPLRNVGSAENPTWSNITPIDNAVFALQAPSVITNERGYRYLQMGSVFVPRGCDLKDGDRLPYQGKTFGVVGDALWDMNQPFTGDDLGYVEYTIRMGG